MNNLAKHVILYEHFFSYHLGHWADFFREKEEEFQEQNKVYIPYIMGGRRGFDRMVVGFTTKYAISAYHHFSCKLKCDSWRSILDTTLCDDVCQ
jgi:hypothetical protein